MPTIDELLEEARANLRRVGFDDLPAGAVLVDIREDSQIERDGELAGAVRVRRNVLEWRCDPRSPFRDPRVSDPEKPLVLVCHEGYQSSLAAAALQRLGHPQATDLIGGFAGIVGRMSALTGGCGCGAIRFEISEPLVGAAYCHCTRCQRRSGTAVQASAKLAPGSFSITEGEEHVGTWQPGSGFDKCFCTQCGSAVFARDPDSGEVAIVRMGAIDGDPGVRPMAHQFVAYAAPWEPIPDDGLPRYDERMPA